jgi:hypothetical protein
MQEYLLHRYVLRMAVDYQASNPFKLWIISLRMHLEIQSVITPVMEAALDPLMHKSLQTPLLTIMPTTVDTPPGESHTHVSYTLST